MPRLLHLWLLQILLSLVLSIGLGHRFSAANPGSQPSSELTLPNLADLRDIVLLQGLGWSDVDIFDASLMSMFTARSDDLFRLVDNRGVQLFPRWIAELEHDVAVVRATPASTQLDPHLLIAYPFAGFFFVNRSNPELAYAIQIGFERAIEDGSYQALVERLLITPWLR